MHPFANILVGDGSLVDLPRTLPAPARYIVHTNSEFADQEFDHDPQIVRMNLTG